MNSTRSSLFIFVIAGFLAGCSTPVGKTKFHEASAGYTPKSNHSTSVDKVWDATLGALEANRIAVATTDNASGTIQTDYLEGQSNFIALGLVAAQSTRYKYNIGIRSQADGSTKLSIICKVESTMKGTSGASQWTDVSGQNGELVRKLEAWLHEEIEKALPKS